MIKQPTIMLDAQKHQARHCVHMIMTDFLDGHGGVKYETMMPLRLDIDHEPVDKPQVLMWRSYMPGERLEKLLVIAAWYGDTLWVRYHEWSGAFEDRIFKMTLKAHISMLEQMAKVRNIRIKSFDEDIRWDNLHLLAEMAMNDALKGI